MAFLPMAVTRLIFAKSEQQRSGYTSCANGEEVGKLPDHGSSSRGVEPEAYGSGIR